MFSYQQQSICNLKFYLLQSMQLPANLTVLRKRVIDQPRYQLVLRIVGVSHAVSIQTGEVSLTEIVACSEVDAARPNLVSAQRLNMVTAYRHCFAGLEYAIDWDVRRLSQNAFSEIARNLVSQQHAGRLLYQFPTRMFQREGVPLTCVDVSCAEGRALIQTYHTYPEELGFVTTRTSIVLK